RRDRSKRRPGDCQRLYGWERPVFVAGGTITLDWWLMGRPEIKVPAQLKGGSVAISRFGSVSDFVARFALQRVGLTPEKDVALVQVGTNTDRFLAMTTKRVEGGVFNPPTSFIGQKKAALPCSPMSLRWAWHFNTRALSRPVNLSAKILTPW